MAAFLFPFEYGKLENYKSMFDMTALEGQFSFLHTYFLEHGVGFDFDIG